MQPDAESSSCDARPRPAGSGRRRGRVALLPPLALVLLFLLFFLPGLPGRAVARELVWIDPCDLSWDGGPDWADPRWAEELEALFCELEPVTTDDVEGLDRWMASISGLSFVRELRRFEVAADGGIDLELELRVPVACIPSGDAFLTVADDGTILLGSWPVPPRFGDRWLPVIGPMSDAYGLFDRAWPGDYLAEEVHVVALEVAVSMAEHLSPREQDLLGRVVIDASGCEVVSVTEPGILLELEEERLVFFGRPPYTGNPGGLDPARKWRSIVRAMELVSPERGADFVDWDVLDARWDRPDLVPRRR